MQFKNDSEELCESLDLQTHWAVSLVFIVIGISLSFLAVLLLMLSMWRSRSEKKRQKLSDLWLVSVAVLNKSSLMDRLQILLVRLSKFKRINYLCPLTNYQRTIGFQLISGGIEVN